MEDDAQVCAAGAPMTEDQISAALRASREDLLTVRSEVATLRERILALEGSLRERVRGVEVRGENVEASVVNLVKSFNDLNDKIDALSSTVAQAIGSARAATWVGHLVAAIVGGVVSAATMVAAWHRP